jgi:hypothetical protein
LQHLHLTNVEPVEPGRVAEFCPGLDYFGKVGTGQWTPDLSSLQHLRCLCLIRPFETSDEIVNSELPQVEMLELGGIKRKQQFRCLTRLLNLRMLTFSDCPPVTGNWLTYLTPLRTLEHLSLFGTRVSDTGIPSLRELQCLQTLDLRITKVSQQGVEKLREALPLAWIQRKNLYDLPPR